jgi:hypothetical protein
MKAASKKSTERMPSGFMEYMLKGIRAKREEATQPQKNGRDIPAESEQGGGDPCSSLIKQRVLPGRSSNAGNCTPCV